MTPRQHWVAAYRFQRSLEHVRAQHNRELSINGLYPSWMPEYRTFLRWCLIASEVLYPRKDPLADRLPHAERVREIEDRLKWCEQTTEEDVRRHIGDRLRDLYSAW